MDELAVENGFGQRSLSKNRAGMGGNLATKAVVSSPPAGHTLLLAAHTKTVPRRSKENFHQFLREHVPSRPASCDFTNLMVVTTVTSGTDGQAIP